MDLRQYLVAPHEQVPQPRQHEEVLTREQVVRGLAAHPDLLASILRCGGIPLSPAPATPVIPTSPRAGRHGNKRSQDLVPFTPISASSAIDNEPPALSTTNSPQTSTPTKILQKHPKARLNKHQKAARKKHLANANYLDIELYTNKDPIRHDRVPHKKTRTCFAWYHGFCIKQRGKCEDLHMLMQRPGLVQPPEGYVHREKCLRDWCPGDWMWEHGPDAVDAAKASDTAEAPDATEETFDTAEEGDMDMLDDEYVNPEAEVKMSDREELYKL
ncbi:hypothetical protein E4T39_05677 [Aureobasidium subglaciale]|nr:hypothetical protein E4T39_05677 [Aureobasidium subglaciale]